MSVTGRELRRAEPMARTLNDIRAKRPLTPDARKRVEDIKRAMQLEIALVELRELRGASQTQVAEALGTSRPNVGRIKKEIDVRLSTHTAGTRGRRTRAAKPASMQGLRLVREFCAES